MKEIGINRNGLNSVEGNDEEKEALAQTGDTQNLQMELNDISKSCSGSMKARLHFYAIRKEKKMEFLKKQKEEREMSEVQKKPKILQKSLRLIQRKKNMLKNSSGNNDQQ